MRLITKEATNAFKNGKKFNKSNMTITVDKNKSKMFLHGNLIATLKDGVLKITNAGWMSNTTKERLNGILNSFGIKDFIFQKDYQWYIGENRKQAEVWDGSQKTYKV